MFDLIGFYTLAYNLHTSSTEAIGEHIHRTVVGRAYYSAFLAAREVCVLKSDQSVHQQVITQWMSKNPKIAVKLRDLKDIRVNADYDLSTRITRTKAGKALLLAKAVLVYTGKLSS